MLVKSINLSAVENVVWPVRNVRAIQTTRLSPFLHTQTLETNFQAFNIAMLDNDSYHEVITNRKNLIKLLPEKSKIQWLKQVHGNDVIDILEQTEQPLVADALITRKKNITLAIMTADCLPILLSHEDGREIAAIHGGWRSLAKNIITETVSKMHSQTDELYAWLGPCIGKKVFEVGEDVRLAFVQQNKIFEQAFTLKKVSAQMINIEKKYLADLQLIAEIQLKILGIMNISVLPECTYTMNNKYYSYRKHNVTGRMVSLISRC